MKRTIEIRKGNVYYKGKLVDDLSGVLMKSFGLRSSRIFKYEITIVEGSRFNVSKDKEYYFVYINNSSTQGRRYKGLVCKEQFNKLFFALDTSKAYDVTVKKIRK